MQTLERNDELAGFEPPHGKRTGRRAFGIVALIAVIAIVAATAVIAYAAGSGDTKTKTVRVVAPASGAKSGTPAAVNDRGFSKLDNGHQAEQNTFEQPLTPAARSQLQNELELGRQVAMKYPTVADAEAAGWRRTGPFAPGLGAHYMFGTDSGYMPEGAANAYAFSHPTSLIYDGTKPTSRIAGLMYYTLGYQVPQGFAGDNDIWHYHLDVCITKDAHGTIQTPFGADTTVTNAMCDGVHGTLIGRTQWMLHAWVVPGYDSPQGVFSHLNEAITCNDGSYHMVPLDRIGYRASACLDGSE
jgi:hypothetical protein